jgi:glycosyltransferase involved in cell wall biosynthesis
MNDPIISVCVICYNQSEYIGQCLESIVKQEFSGVYEVVVADDYSTDNTLDIVNSYKAKYPDLIKVIKSEGNIGVAANIIKAMSKCEGEYIALCEGDDFWICNEKLEMQLDFFKKNETCSYLFTNKKILDGENMVEEECYDFSLIPLRELLKRNIMPGTPTIMFKSKYLPKVFPSFVYEAFNVDWCLLFFEGWKGDIGYIDKPTAVHRRNVGVISKSINSFKFLNGLKTNKALNLYTNKEYDFHIGNFEWHLESICNSYLEEGLRLNALKYFCKKILYSLINNKIKFFVSKNTLFIKHFAKSVLLKK